MCGLYPSPPDYFTRSLHDALPISKLVRDAGKQAAQTPDAMLHRELAQPQRRGRGHSPDTRAAAGELQVESVHGDRKSTRLNSSHTVISYAVFCLKKKK